MRRIPAVAILSVVLVLASLTAAQATDYTFEGLGGVETIPQGINNDTAVGSYRDDHGIHGFTLTYHGTPALFDCPDAHLVTDAIGINNAGTVVGTYIGADRHYHGFSRSGENYVTIDAVGAVDTYATGINNEGTIVGYFKDPDGKYHGFVRNGTYYHEINYPGAGVSDTHAHGINDDGTIVGWYYNPNRRGFVATGPDYEPADYKPLDYAEGAVTVPYGINNEGTIAGWYNSGNGAHGFALSGTTFQTIDHDFSSWAGYATYVFGINDAGIVVGSYGELLNVPFLGIPTFTFSGTVTADHCTDTECSSSPFPDVVIDVTYNDTTMQTTTAADGTYSIQVWAGSTYTITPSFPNDVDFMPSSYKKTPTGSEDDLDFTACVDKLPADGILRPGFQASGFTVTTAKKKCDPDDIDWAMPDHMIAGNKFNNDSDYYTGLLGHDQIYPPDGWVVDLFLTKNKLRVGTCDNDPLVEWRWEVNPKAKVITKPKPGCTSSMKVKALGTYTVTAKKYTRKSIKNRFTFDPVNGIQVPAKLKPPKPVLVRDFIIVGMGDSNASGEGNGPYNDLLSVGNLPWIFEKCDRSQTSYQFQSALYVEQRDPHSSVTFLFPACSGARIEHLYRQSYDGINPDGYPLDPQITQVKKLLKRTGAPGEPTNPRKVDAVILSIGVNNLYFGALMGFCVTQGLLGRTNCQNLPAHLVASTGPSAGVGDKEFVYDANSKTTVAQIIRGLQNDLNFPWYSRLKQDLNTVLGIADNHVIISQYPDFSHDGQGNTCDTASTTFAGVPKWGASTWAWLSAQTGVLNSHVAQTGWRVAKLNQNRFLNHGYCAGDFRYLAYPWFPFMDTVPYFGQSFFLGLIEGNGVGNLQGAFHPIRPGQGITAGAVEPQICNALFGNSTCKGPPPK